MQITSYNKVKCVIFLGCLLRLLLPNCQKIANKYLLYILVNYEVAEIMLVKMSDISQFLIINKVYTCQNNLLYGI